MTFLLLNFVSTSIALPLHCDSNVITSYCITSYLSGPSSSLWEDSPTCVGELLTWLGAGRSPSILVNRWLPLGTVVSVEQHTDIISILCRGAITDYLWYSWKTTYTLLSLNVLWIGLYVFFFFEWLISTFDRTLRVLYAKSCTEAFPICY